jgi:phosphopantothenoylcysteine synthetase/decarboxylase
MKNPLNELLDNYKSSLILNAKLSSTIIAMSKALIETDNIFNIEIADLMIADLRKHFEKSKMIQEDFQTFEKLLKMVDDIEADCKVKKLMLNL